ncbi:F0F1 ATP synthase subunit B [secondary endosymbiont of Ctenarytaina eucalypti]|uniref:ATP synthase subunit b n=1 Tax=secondary endosymbiont of Ctenarytaina eucalypti TaxID=1199245 RepID=J3YS80_9ENTR|nr:F0F1 ATP synthase subunit B [secondary endosymbiont of Ctenarytaina eucalypti]AFP85033.1 ATP synthase, F0 subunit b [secondary endosymbiont of Ctenarytaina eucalypti]
MNLNATILGQAIAFILFVLFCMKYVWPPLMSAIDMRQKEIAAGLAAAERAQIDLEIAHNAANEHLQQARLEARVIIEQAHKRKGQVIEEARTAAEMERNKILAHARTKINAEYNRAREGLRKQVATLAVAAAEKIIERSLYEHNTDIIDKIIDEL